VATVAVAFVADAAGAAVVLGVGVVVVGVVVGVCNVVLVFALVVVVFALVVVDDLVESVVPQQMSEFQQTKVQYSTVNFNRCYTSVADTNDNKHTYT